MANFSIGGGSASAILPIPDETDSLDLTARKLGALAAVVKQGKSLAVHTGYRGGAHNTRDPIELAKESMTVMEFEQFEAWTSGVIMPPFDFETNKENLPGAAGNRERHERRARAMNKIWNVDNAAAENSMYVSNYMTYMVPLLIAVSKVEAAESELEGGSEEGLSDIELKEIQIAHKIVAVATNNMNRVMEQMRKLTSSINSSKELVQARERNVKSKITGYKHKTYAVNDMRYLKEAAIRHDIDYFTLAARGRRDDRTDLRGGIRRARIPTSRPRRIRHGGPT